jgi:hypothetical protein
MSLNIFKIMGVQEDNTPVLEASFLSCEESISIDIDFDTWEYYDKKNLNKAKKELIESIKYSDRTVCTLNLDKESCIHLINFLKSSFNI